VLALLLARLQPAIDPLVKTARLKHDSRATPEGWRGFLLGEALR
jgi:hypothetical protein